MSDADVAELQLPAEEKLRLLELLWESLSAGASPVPGKPNEILLLVH